LQHDKLEVNVNTNHPHASLFETIEAYINTAVGIVADPSLYVRCYDSLINFSKILLDLP